MAIAFDMSNPPCNGECDNCNLDCNALMIMENVRKAFSVDNRQTIIKNLSYFFIDIGIEHKGKYTLKSVWVYAWLTNKFILVNSINRLRFYNKDIILYYFPIGVNPNA